MYISVVLSAECQYLLAVIDRNLHVAKLLTQYGHDPTQRDLKCTPAQNETCLSSSDVVGVNIFEY